MADTAQDTKETSWWDGLLDTVKEVGGGLLNYDLKKTEIKNNSTTSSTGQYEPTTTPSSSNNNTLLIMGGVVAIVIILVMVKK